MFQSMGIGDEIMASGMARGAAARGRRVAFGDGVKIKWSRFSELVFRNNPNVAAPGCEFDTDIEWIPYYKGHRIYNEPGQSKWTWNYGFKPIPGEFFFSDDEINYSRSYSGSGLVIIEPNVPQYKSVASNKQWAPERFHAVARRLMADGHRVAQFSYGGLHSLPVEQISTPDFRRAVAILAHARLYIGPEGGMHHAAAAMGVPAVVIFGGFVPPQVTGYDFHHNVAVGKACGSWLPCAHCYNALRVITEDMVYQPAREFLDEGSTTSSRARGIYEASIQRRYPFVSGGWEQVWPNAAPRRNSVA